MPDPAPQPKLNLDRPDPNEGGLQDIFIEFLRARDPDAKTAFYLMHNSPDPAALATIDFKLLEQVLSAAAYDGQYTFIQSFVPSIKHLSPEQSGIIQVFYFFALVQELAQPRTIKGQHKPENTQFSELSFALAIQAGIIDRISHGIFGTRDNPDTNLLSVFLIAQANLQQELLFLSHNYINKDRAIDGIVLPVDLSKLINQSGQLLKAIRSAGGTDEFFQIYCQHCYDPEGCTITGGLIGHISDLLKDLTSNNLLKQIAHLNKPEPATRTVSSRGMEDTYKIAENIDRKLLLAYAQILAIKVIKKLTDHIEQKYINDEELMPEEYKPWLTNAGLADLQTELGLTGQQYTHHIKRQLNKKSADLAKAADQAIDKAESFLKGTGVQAFTSVWIPKLKQMLHELK